LAQADVFLGPKIIGGIASLEARGAIGAHVRFVPVLLRAFGSMR
jgi:hypothetical protein